MSTQRQLPSPPPPLAVTVVPGRQATVIAVTGELDIATAPLLVRELRAVIDLRDDRPVVLDLTSLGFLGAAGLETIAAAGAAAASQHRPFRVQCPNPQQRRLFAITELDRHLSVTPDGSGGERLTTESTDPPPVRQEARVPHLEAQLANHRLALESRDIIGQAKAIIMASTGCDADKAFGLLKVQSQAENRKETEIAAELRAQPQLELLVRVLPPEVRPEPARYDAEPARSQPRTTAPPG